MLFISSRDLLNELCDEKRFAKTASGALKELRNGVEDGLFTAFPGEHNWEVAHRVLMPAFGAISVRTMFDEMHDIASQLVVKWARFGGQQRINVTEDFTRLTLDSIALSAMDARFNSFYKEEMHPFVGAMMGMLAEAGARANRPALASYFMRATQRKFEEDIAMCKKVAGDLVQARKDNPTDKKDLLNAMLNGKDPKTGEQMTAESVLNNMITFMVAGHETTSGMLSFLFYHLLKNPSAYQAAQKEVEEVVGKGPITVDHMSKLPFLNACLRETLRLNPTGPVFALQMRPDSTEDHTLIGGGKYMVKKGQTVAALLPMVHKDPAVFGEDAEEFKPERMLDEPFAALPPNSWKPFGNGMRGCIGRPFAWQEALLATAMLLQNFNFRLDDPSYTLIIQQTLTLKPKNFYMHAALKDGIDVVHLEKHLHAGVTNDAKTADKRVGESYAKSGASKEPMTILYGSNSGTCEALAQSLARAAGARGYQVVVNSLDTAVGAVPKAQPVVLICSSYEGEPPDNASHFCAWLDGLNADNALKDVKYAVYGCGNRDWATTFHKVPRKLHSSFKKLGAAALAPPGLGDVAAGDIFNDFDKWQDDVFWPALGGSKDGPVDEDGLVIEIDTTSRQTLLRQDLREAIIISNEILTAPGEIERRHIELKLPTDMSYKAGDYLAVLPVNNTKTIHRVLKRFGLPWDAMLTIKAGSNTTLPVGRPISAMDVLGAFVELSQPATRRNVHKIADSITDPEEREVVTQQAGADFEKAISLKRVSPLDILEAHPAAALPLASFLEMLPPMRIRQYSISSSPLSDPTTASLTWTVLDSPSKAADGKRHLGVASNYLSHLETGDRAHVAVKPSHGSFHPPSDIEKTPIIMLCAGSGLAPFRGFVQERAVQKAAGRSLAEAHLFIGCQHPDKDALFKSELEQWEKDGIVKVYYAFSKSKDSSCGARYVQERLWTKRKEMVEVFNRGAKLYICGSAGVGEGVAAMVKKIFAEWCEDNGKDKSEEEVDEWFNSIKGERYASDVFV